MSTNQTPQDRSIYGGYRATLKSIHRGPNTRAGSRKQEALRITAERYKVPISTVKAIVREQEAQEGIVHEPTANLLERRRLNGLYNEELTRVLTANPERSCSHCGGKADDEIELRSGGTMKRGASRLRLDPGHYRKTGEAHFIDACLPCWVIEFGYSGASSDKNSQPLVWSAQTV